MGKFPPSVARRLRRWLLAACHAAPFIRRLVLSRPAQLSECLVLRKLTVESILLIIDYLSATDKIILSQTCSQFHNILRQSTPQGHLSASTLTLTEHDDYLCRLSRDNEDSWACDTCRAVHVFHPEDTPRRKLHLACPWSTTKVSSPKRAFLILEWPQYRHVHLALKLSRQDSLSRRQSAYLAALLEGSQRDHSHSPRRPTLRKTHTSHPKIIQGRYLLKVVQYFEDPMWSSEDLFLDGVCLLTFNACAHQRFRDEDLASGMTHVRRRKHQRLRKGNPRAYPRLLDEDIETAVEMAFGRKGQIVQGSCPQCPTDFTVQIWRNRAILCTWSDRGEETSSDENLLDAYRIHPALVAYPYCSEFGVKHEPGIVQSLYECGE